MSFARGRAAAVLLLLALPAAARASRGRLAFSLVTGGGYASDAVGAALGSDGFAEIAPATRLDLSLSPAWKMTASGELTYVHYFSSSDPSWTEDAAWEARWIASDRCQLSFGLEGEHASYAPGALLDPLLVASATATETTAGTATAAVRWQALGMEWRAAGAGTARTSALAGDDVTDQELGLIAGARHAIGDRGAISLAYQLDSDGSARPEVSVTSHALIGRLAWGFSRLFLQAQLHLQTSSFGTGVGEQFVRATGAASYAIARGLDVEAYYAFAAHDVGGPAPFSATRHLAFVDLRWRWAEVSW
jgi:hypothetical protein